ATVSDPVATYEAVREELELYNPALAAKPELVALNKIDRPDVRERLPLLLERFRQEQPQLRVIPVSAITTQGVKELTAALAETLAALPKEVPRPAETMKVYRLPQHQPDEGWTIEREDDAYRVRGKRVERIVAMTDLTNPDAVDMLQGTLTRMGVLQALEAAGVGS